MVPSLEDAQLLAKLWADGDAVIDLSKPGVRSAPTYSRFIANRWIVPVGDSDYDFKFSAVGYEALKNFFLAR